MFDDLDFLRDRYQFLIKRLSQTVKEPISENHCFGRVILDYICQDKWNRVLSKPNQPGYKQLTEDQLQKAIARMELWLNDNSLLVLDNEKSLSYRSKKSFKKRNHGKVH